ncbi:MAG: RNA methyltransferase [Culturomica sp.]|jgi:16S rRNA C967 or C1407 C5-methylase (RsmB/RsmF family)/NOL1/NOP2/fmu family ribosome biogenesis protein|nr:RNA methyltransferase [Culturomica sp.]
MVLENKHISLPEAFCKRMERLLNGEFEDFNSALSELSPVSVRMNPLKKMTQFESAEIDDKVEWCSDGFYLKQRPIFTLDPCFHGGAYYVQEASSMFLGYVLRQITDQQPLRVLDLCASPGGKTTLTASVLPEGSLLIANEVIQSRAAILKENVIRWGYDNIVVSNNDPADFRPLNGAFDIVIVDAPCSGEGMFRKERKALEEWSEQNLALCAARQKRILADVWDSLKPDGFLIYSTCTYNPEENELITEWLLNNYDCKSVSVEHPYKTITPTADNGYRFYPHKTRGEGFFITVVQKGEGKVTIEKKSKKTPKIAMPKELAAMINPTVETDTYFKGNMCGILPAAHTDFLKELEKHLKITYKGCEMAEIFGNKYKLLHPLALYVHLNKSACNVLPLQLSDALKYLRKEEITANNAKGDWILLTFNDIALGWAKNIGNRLNNYFPKEWRIRMS